MGNIFYLHNVVGGVVQKIKRQIWRQDTQCQALRFGRRAKRIWIWIWINFIINIFYLHNVVGDKTYSKNTKIGGGMWPAVTFWKTYRANIDL